MIFLQDLRYGFRMLLKSPGFTIVVVAALGLGIGANTAIFSVVNALILQRLPYRAPDRLAKVWEDASSVGFPANTPSPGSYMDWKMKIPAFEDVAAVDTRDFNLTGDGEPEKIGAAGATINLFSVFGVKPFLGRVFLPEEDKRGNRVVLASYGLWTRRFGADRGIVGRTLLLNGERYTVIGVMPPRFQFPVKDVELWTPAGYTARQLADRGNHFLNVVARLKSGATIDQVNAQLRVLAERLQHDYPGSNRFTGMYAVPLLDDYLGDTKQALVVLLAAVGCVLLIACANIANLLLARATGRRREMAVRIAIGAGRRRVVGQLFTENLILSIAGGGLGLLLAGWSFAALKNLVPEQLASITSLRLDWRVMLFTLAISMLTGLLFGMAPAWQVSRTELNIALKDGSRGSVGQRRNALRNSLVMGEIALAMTLLVCATLMIRSLSHLRGLDPGFRPDHVLTLRLKLPESKYGDFPRRVDFANRVLEKVRTLPGVKSAGITSALPLIWKGGSSGFWPEGQTVAVARASGLAYDANNRVVTPGYFETMGMRLLNGRLFDARDGAESPLAVIVSETMARQYWPNENPIGKRLKHGDPDEKIPWRTIVGIAADVRTMGLDQPARAELYFPLAQSAGNWMWPRDLVIRAGVDPLQLVGAVRQAVWSVDRDQPISNIALMDELVDKEVVQSRTQALLLGAFAGLALVLACLGIYGVLSFIVTEQTPEIGVRLALGAQPGDIVRSIAGRALKLAVAGVLMGAVLAFWATRLLQRLLFQVEAHDPGTFAALAAVLMAVCLLAVWAPARRASRVDPITALRYE